MSREWEAVLSRGMVIISLDPSANSASFHQNAHFSERMDLKSASEFRETLSSVMNIWPNDIGRDTTVSYTISMQKWSYFI